MTVSAANLAPRARTVATLQRIVEATRALLADNDYASLSMRAIATAAGISPGAIYRHFSSKRHLVDYVCRASLEQFEIDLERAAAAHPPGSFARVVALGAEYIRLAHDRPQHFKILFTPVQSRPVRLRDLPGEGGFRLLRQSVAEAMAAGNIRSGDPDLAAFLLWSRVHGIVTLMMACDFTETLPLPADEVTPERLFELSRTLLWEGFKPTEAESAGSGE